MNFGENMTGKKSPLICRIHVRVREDTREMVIKCMRENNFPSISWAVDAMLRHSAGLDGEKPLEVEEKTQINQYKGKIGKIIKGLELEARKENSVINNEGVISFRNIELLMMKMTGSGDQRTIEKYLGTWQKGYATSIDENTNRPVRVEGFRRPMQGDMVGYRHTKRGRKVIEGVLLKVGIVEPICNTNSRLVFSFRINFDKARDWLEDPSEALMTEGAPAPEPVRETFERVSKLSAELEADSVLNRSANARIIRGTTDEDHTVEKKQQKEVQNSKKTVELEEPENDQEGESGNDGS